MSRQNLVNNPETSFEGSLKGGYVVSKEQSEAMLTLLATGSEVNTAISIQKMLLNNGVDTRVVSLPALDVFDRQSEDYKNEVFGVDYDKRVFLEAGKSDMLYKYAKTVFGIDRFGESAPSNDVFNDLGYTVETLAEKILHLVK